MILLIDNYDSFVYNLSRYLLELGCETRVVRNDRLSVTEIAEMKPEAIVLSPGPGEPAAAGVCIALIQQLGKRIPMLGVCLGHQAMAAAYGGRIIRAPEPFHGRTSLITHHDQSIFVGLSNPLRVMRYHSLIVDEASLPHDWTITARTAEGIPMAMEHRTWPLFGVQFHPESILTEGGYYLLHRFLNLAKIAHQIPSQSGHLELQPSSIPSSLAASRFIPW
ncbi:MAG: aminodeoxychorismate/anthranilate synthase component II [Planctomycetota bacterium]|nr:aminodeoxychorismate/anthranilate synthase component II [Planctomycetota bacterium]MDA1212159.1 aminodeoxychorismate/anthranilate synthase component II [Planctomycetota bacterium]